MPSDESVARSAHNPATRWTLSLFAALAALAALDAAFASAGMTPFALGLRWLRVHLVTLGLMLTLTFASLPTGAPRNRGRDADSPTSTRWLLLTVGIVTLLVGIAAMRRVAILAGGLLVLACVLWLLAHRLRWHGLGRSWSGLRFHLAGLAFVAVGAFVGTGLWLGWGDSLAMVTPKEVHIHANLWGFASLVLAGWVIDLAPRLVPQWADRRWTVPTIWGLMVLGASLLLVAPWIGSTPLMVGGIVPYALATALLYVTYVLPLRRAGGAGAAHLLTAWLWILVPLVALPFIVLRTGSAPTARVEDVAPSILAYGWLLQAIVALAPAVLARDGRNETRPALGGSILTWMAINGSAAGLLASVAFPDNAGPLLAVAFVLLAVALAAFARQMLLLDSRPAPAGST